MPRLESPPRDPTTWRHRLLAALRSVFGLDLRSLACLRIGMGLIMLADLLIRSRDLTAHYTDAGLLPRHSLTFNSTRWEYVSLHMASGSTSWIALLFVVQAIAAGCFLVGYRTRLANLVAWVLLVSLHIRNPIVLQGGDTFICLMFFWTLFLPMSRIWSLDSRRASARARPAPQVTGVASSAYIFQLCFIYLFTAALKTGDAWLEGQAVYLTLHLDMFAKQPQTALILEYPRLLELLTHGVLALEWTAPFVVLVPLFQQQLRMLLIPMMCSLHAGLFGFMALGLFPAIMIVAWIGLLPPWFWDRLLPRIHRLRWVPTDPAGPRVRLSGASHLITALMLMLSFSWNLSTLSKKHYVRLGSQRIYVQRAVPQQVLWLAYITRFEQRWSMFSPQPPRDDGWYVIPATRRDGTTLDLYTGRPITHDKPAVPSRAYPSQRWRKLMRNLWREEHKLKRRDFGRWLCRRYNTDTPEPAQVTTFEILYLRELTPRPGEPALPVEPLVTWTHDCFGETPEEEGKLGASSQELEVELSPAERAQKVMDELRSSVHGSDRAP